MRPTSLEAYQSVREKLSPQERAVFREICESDRGMTGDELVVRLEWVPGVISARIRGLVKKGHIIETTERRKTRSGCWATVWGLPSTVEEQGELF